MQANSLVVNTAKTVVLIITPELHLSILRANNHKSLMDFTFNNQTVQPFTSAKYLNNILFSSKIELLVQ